VFADGFRGGLEGGGYGRSTGRLSCSRWRTSPVGCWAAFEQYLLRDRGPVELTVQGYQRVARSFLVSRFEEGIRGLSS
jgi:hypothetical protein